jgi:hypothetical protein
MKSNNQHQTKNNSTETTNRTMKQCIAEINSEKEIMKKSDAYGEQEDNFHLSIKRLYKKIGGREFVSRDLFINYFDLIVSRMNTYNVVANIKYNEDKQQLFDIEEKRRLDSIRVVFASSKLNGDCLNVVLTYLSKPNYYEPQVAHMNYRYDHNLIT